MLKRNIEQDNFTSKFTYRVGRRCLQDSPGSIFENNVRFLRTPKRPTQWVHYTPLRTWHKQKRSHWFPGMFFFQPESHSVGTRKHTWHIANLPDSPFAPLRYISPWVRGVIQPHAAIIIPNTLSMNSHAWWSSRFHAAQKLRAKGFSIHKSCFTHRCQREPMKGLVFRPPPPDNCHKTALYLQCTCRAPDKVYFPNRYT